MPIYTYACSDCEAEQDAFRSIEKRNDAPDCDLCGIKTHKIISSYAAIGDLEPYYDDNLQSYVKSKQHRKQVMREQDVCEKFGKKWY